MCGCVCESVQLCGCKYAVAQQITGAYNALVSILGSIFPLHRAYNALVSMLGSIFPLPRAYNALVSMLGSMFPLHRAYNVPVSMLGSMIPLHRAYNTLGSMLGKPNIEPSVLPARCKGNTETSALQALCFLSV